MSKKSATDILDTSLSITGVAKILLVLTVTILLVILSVSVTVLFRRQMFIIIIMTAILMLLSAFLFGYLLFTENRKRKKNELYFNTKNLLVIQKETSEKLLNANLILRESEERFSVTIDSIGDAVLTTDSLGLLTGLNPVAERLTGWKIEDAIGRPVDEIFKIINQKTRKPSKIPVMTTLEHGTIQGLANHTILISRNGGECSIADSCAPIRNHQGIVIGAVLIFRDVTENYEIQQKLQDSSSQLQAILNTVGEGIITMQASGAVITTVNPAAAKMFGYQAEELTGKNLADLIPELDRDKLNSTLEYYKESDDSRMAGIGREVTGMRKEGSSFPLEIAMNEMTLAGERFFIGVLRDITTRKRTEEALLAAGALQRAIFESANFSCIATDASGVIQIFNVGAERMLGYEAAEVLNKITPADISDPIEVIARASALSIELSTEISPGFDALVFKASRGIEDIYELTYIRQDGRRFPAVVSVTALRDILGTIIGYLLIGTDNTARKQIEEERKALNQTLLDKNDELQIAKYRAEKANLAKSDFLSSMSHELRTPLSAVLGFAQLIESGTPSPTPSQKRSIDQILKAGWYLLELINEILDLALIESGKITLSLEPVSLSEVLEECQEMVEPQAKKRGITISFAQFGIHYFVLADRTRLKQVFLNLLSNSIKYNKEHGIVDVEITLIPPNSIRISVKDTGEGLSSEQIGQLFEPFNRLGKEGTAEEGTGIGLVVCKRLIELMGGIVCVESEPGKGSVFAIEMTLMDEPGSHAAMPKLISNEQPNNESAKPKRTLLYVEDNPANLMLVEDLIQRRSDLRIISARNGISGVSMALSFLPDIILMDINIPGISGTEALKIISADVRTAHTPIIALSANAIPRDIERGMNAGFFRYLTKPIKIEEFMETLDLALNTIEGKL